MRTVNIDNVEAGIAGALGGIHVVTLNHVDVALIHFLAVSQCFELGSILARAARGCTRFHARCVGAAVPELNAGQRAVLVYLFGHRAQIAYVAFIPQTGGKTVSVIGLWMDGAVFGVHRCPTALSLHRTVCGLKAGLVGTGTDTVRHLVKTIAQCLGADLDRFKQYVVLGIACHDISSSS